MTSKFWHKNSSYPGPTIAGDIRPNKEIIKKAGRRTLGNINTGFAPMFVELTEYSFAQKAMLATEIASDRYSWGGKGKASLVLTPQ